MLSESFKDRSNNDIYLYIFGYLRMLYFVGNDTNQKKGYSTILVYPVLTIMGWRSSFDRSGQGFLQGMNE
jgi:hypothetical protein